MEKVSKYFTLIFLVLGLLISGVVVISDMIAEHKGWHNEAALASMQIYLNEEMHPVHHLDRPVEGTISCGNSSSDVRGVPCYYKTQDGTNIKKACHGWRLFPRKYVSGVTWSCTSI